MNPEHLIPDLPSPKNIGIFGGSFNPPHIGHSMAILYAMAMHELDQVWVIPTGVHAEGKELLDFGHRFKMAQIAFTRIRNCRVIMLENFLEPPNFTNRTLRAINEAQPNARLHLIVGEDCFTRIHEWEGGQDTMKQARLIGVPRSGYDSEGHLLPEISSSEIRESLGTKQSTERHVDAGVRSYIKRHGLYET